MPDYDENKAYGFASLIPQRILSFFPSNRKFEGASDIKPSLAKSLSPTTNAPPQTSEQTLESLNLFPQPPGAYLNYDWDQTYFDQPEVSLTQNPSRSRPTSIANTLHSPTRDPSKSRTSNIKETHETREHAQSTQHQRPRTVSSVSTSSNLSTLSSLSTTHSPVRVPSRTRTPSIREVVEPQERKEPAYSYRAPRPLSNVSNLSVSQPREEKPARTRTPSISLTTNDVSVATSSYINQSPEFRGKVFAQPSSSNGDISVPVLLPQSPKISTVKPQPTVTGHLRPQTAEEAAHSKSRDKLAQVLTQLSESISRAEAEPGLTRSSKAKSQKEGPKELWQTIPNEPTSALSRSVYVKPPSSFDVLR